MSRKRSPAPSANQFSEGTVLRVSDRGRRWCQLQESTTGRDDLGYVVGPSSLVFASGQQDSEFSSGYAIVGASTEKAENQR